MPELGDPHLGPFRPFGWYAVVGYYQDIYEYWELALPDSTHTCPAVGCSEQVPYSRLACYEHWYELPQELRQRILRAWKDKRWTAHRVAIAEAIDFYNGVQGGVDSQ